MALQPRATTPPSPSPISFGSSQAWKGNDGSWSTFVIRVGTPEQVFHVLISTNGQETWVPVPEGCIAGDPVNCGELRGVLPFKNIQGTGFLVNASSTWALEGLFQLGNGEELNYTGNGQYGLDTVGIMLPNSGGVSLPKQVVAGIATKDYYLGQFGLGPKPTNFTTFDNPTPSFITTLKNQSLIPSVSWGYTAGAPYRQKKVPGSLTLGGYDASRFEKNDLNFTFSADDSRYLTVGLQSIQASGTLKGTMSLLPSGILALIDSTFPEIWLPTPACSIFEAAFGLNYDPRTDRYLINDTIRETLNKNNPVLSFKIGNEANGGPSTTISLPYAAFDLVANHPIYPNATRYFPLRRAANDTQYTLGRTFLQEAYVIADYERLNFSVSQTLFPDSSQPKLISILSPSSLLLPTNNSSSGLSRSAIIGIAVALAVLLILTLTGLYLFFRIRKRRREQEKEENEKRVEEARRLQEQQEMEFKHASGRSELMSQAIGRDKYGSGASELVGVETRHELRTLESPVELPGSPVSESFVRAVRGVGGGVKSYDVTGGERRELEGSDVGQISPPISPGLSFGSAITPGGVDGGGGISPRFGRGQHSPTIGHGHIRGDSNVSNESAAVGAAVDANSRFGRGNHSPTIGHARGDSNVSNESSNTAANRSGIDRFARGNQSPTLGHARGDSNVSNESGATGAEGVNLRFGRANLGRNGSHTLGHGRGDSNVSNESKVEGGLSPASVVSAPGSDGGSDSGGVARKKAFRWSGRST